MTDSTTEPRYVLRGGQSWRDPWAEYRQLRDAGAVHREVHPKYGEFFVLSRFAEVFDAVRDTVTFSSARGLTLDPDVMAIFEGRAGADRDDGPTRPHHDAPARQPSDDSTRRRGD